ncbi:MAG: hypothetical protein OES28_05450 [Desulfobulbaceae bacterium]|jgi:hypothetical protein|nr:hypothetical protein [Deltaproteobacteria bacterium]MDH3331053.1 hypothetical protein [Desulfobulbaceae bacterium]HKJ15601.1 hypothetical protein [Desulfobulbales bacterium]MDH3542473.1 hypothetical protein [Desulfobulbaceae bacterium]MDH3775613.1 hypothetical protein [Desulfobulbaceae bacterium]
MTSNMRLAKRISVELRVKVYLFDNKGKTRIGDPVGGRITNFSPLGAALSVPAIMMGEKHLFYTCNDNPDFVLQLEFELRDSSEKIITVPATPVWFDRDHEPDIKQFNVGLKFLADSKSPEIQTLSKEACKDEKMLVSIWKKLF